MKYCPKCGKVALTKALQNYSQVDFRGIRGKRRKIAHLEEDGGCGHVWYTVEVVEDALVE
jgi:ribosomal protein L32